MKEKKTGRALGMQWFTTGVSTTLVLILLGVVIFFMMFANRLSDSVKENFTVTVLMSIRADEADVAEFEAMFDLMPYTNKVEYISKEQALGEQIDAMGKLNYTEYVREYITTNMITDEESELYGCVKVDEKFAEVLGLLMDKYTFPDIEYSWAKLCYYYKYVGPVVTE